MTIKSLDLYSEKGTGKAVFDPCSWYYTSPVPLTVLELPYEDGCEINGIVFCFDNRRPLTGNAELDAEVQKYQLNMLDRIIELITVRRSDLGSGQFSFTFTCVNGYLSVIVDYSEKYTVGAMWDIESGKRLQLSDLFAYDSDFIAQLNHTVQEYIDYDVAMFDYDYKSVMRPFKGIEAGFDSFSLAETYGTIFSFKNQELHLNLYFNPGDNSYFNKTQTIVCELRTLDGCLVREARESSLEEQSRKYFAHENDIQRQEILLSEETSEQYGCTVEYRWKDITGYAGADKINSERYKYLKETYDIEALTWSDEAVERALAELGDYILQNHNSQGELTREDLQYCRLVIEYELCYFGEKYVAVSSFARAQYNDTIGFSGGVYSGEKLTLYDLDTGEEVDIGVLFTGEPDGDWYLNDSGNLTACERPEQITITGITCNRFIFIKDSSGLYNLITADIMLRYKAEDGSTIYLVVDDDYINRF